MSSLLGVALGVVIGLLAGLVYIVWWKARYTKAIRENAVLRSHAVITGRVSEQLSPILPGSFNETPPVESAAAKSPF